MPLNVLWVHQDATPPTQPGPDRSFQFMRQLALRGHRPVILASQINRFTRQVPSDTALDNVLVEGVRFLRIPVPKYRDNSIARIRNLIHFSLAIPQVLRNYPFPPPDVIIGSSPFPTVAWGAARLARRLGRPFVMEIRDFWPETLMELGQLNPWNPVVQTLAHLQGRAIRQAACILSPLWGAEAHVQRMKGVCPVHLLLNGCLPGPPPQTLPTAPFSLIYAGALNTGNDVGTIADALKLLEPQLRCGQLRMTFIGDGPARLKMEQALVPLGVSFSGAIPRNELANHLARAHGFVAAVRDLPMYKQGLGLNKLFDYMAAGRPIIFAAPGTQDPVFRSGCGIKVAPENPKELADAIIKLMAIPEKTRMILGLQGRSYLEQHHNYEIIGQRLESILINVAASRESQG